MNQTITLPIEVVERALASLESEFGKHSKSASDIRAALEQPQNRVPNAGNMVPARWKLVLVDPTDAMTLAATKVSLRNPAINGVHQYRAMLAAMLAAAPQPPTTEGSSEVQAQGEQEPVTTLTIEVEGPMHKVDFEWGDPLRHLPAGSYELYLHPQPKREPLTPERKVELVGSYFAETWAQVAAFGLLHDFERALGIGGEDFDEAPW